MPAPDVFGVGVAAFPSTLAHDLPTRKATLGQKTGRLAEVVAHRCGQNIEKAGGHLERRKIPIATARLDDLHHMSVPGQADAVRAGYPQGR